MEEMNITKIKEKCTVIQNERSSLLSKTLTSSLCTQFCMNAYVSFVCVYMFYIISVMFCKNVGIHHCTITIIYFYNLFLVFKIHL